MRPTFSIADEKLIWVIKPIESELARNFQEYYLTEITLIERTVVAILATTYWPITCSRRQQCSRERKHDANRTLIQYTPSSKGEGYRSSTSDSLIESVNLLDAKITSLLTELLKAVV